MGLFKLLWWTTKFGVKHVIIPIATTALIAALLDKLADKVAGDNVAQQKLNGYAYADPVTA